jgi:hypothetical protein
MPAFDGTGPRGQGPMSGRGEGYCVMVIPAPETREQPHGYAGLEGRPVRMEQQTNPRGHWSRRTLHRCPLVSRRHAPWGRRRGRWGRWE